MKLTTGQKTGLTFVVVCLALISATYMVLPADQRHDIIENLYTPPTTCPPDEELICWPTSIECSCEPKVCPEGYIKNDIGYCESDPRYYVTYVTTTKTTIPIETTTDYHGTITYYTTEFTSETMLAAPDNPELPDVPAVTELIPILAFLGILGILLVYRRRGKQE